MDKPNHKILSSLSEARRQSTLQDTSHPLNDDERQLLGRVREHVVQAYQQHHASRPATHQTTPLLKLQAWFNRSFFVGASAAALVLLFLSMTPPTPEDSLPLETKGQFQLQLSQQQKDTQSLQVKIPLGQQGTLQAPKRWEVKAHSKSAFNVIRHPRSLDLQLKRGRLQIHVHPKTMKRFAIHFHKRYKLLVKGTRFTVEQARPWLHVEVQRGRVEIHPPKGQIIEVRAGQGLRIAFEQHTTRRYNAARHPLTTRDRLAALLQQDPSLMVRHTKILILETSDPVARRREIVDIAAGLLHRAHHYQQEARLWSLAHQTRLYTSKQAFPLYAGCQSCQQLSKPGEMCQQLCKEFLKHSTDDFTKKNILYMMTMRWTRASDQQARRRAQQLCQMYLKIQRPGAFDQIMKKQCPPYLKGDHKR